MAGLIPENQTGDQVAAQADELRLGFMIAVACGFFGDPLLVLRAVAASNLHAAIAITHREGTGVAAALDAEAVIDVSASGGGGEGDQGSADGKGSSGEVEAIHGI